MEFNGEQPMIIRDSYEAQNSLIGVIASALSSGRLSINSLDDGSGVVLDIEQERMMTMNASGIRLMQAIAEGNVTSDALTEVLSNQYGVSTETAGRDVRNFVRETASRLGDF